jgi:CDP-diacylglycerol pyrophosphatase
MCKRHPDGKDCVFVPTGAAPKTHLVIKDDSREKPDGYLLLPYGAVTGIESPALQETGAPNYFAEAWAWAAADLATRAGEPIPPDRTGLAVNSVAGRTQDQLHIHISCVRADVAAALAAARPGMGDSWGSAASLELLGKDWSIIRLDAGGLDSHDPFKTLDAWALANGVTMAEQTVAVVGDGRDRLAGFFVIDGDDAYGGPTDAEDLLDQHCRDLRGSG